MEKPQSGLPGGCNTCKALAALLVFLFFLFSLPEFFSLCKAQLFFFLRKWKQLPKVEEVQRPEKKEKWRWGSNEENNWGQQEDSWQLCLVQKSRTENILGDRWTGGSHGQRDAPIGIQVTTAEYYIFTQTHKLITLPGQDIFLDIFFWACGVHFFWFLPYSNSCFWITLQLKTYIKLLYEFLPLVSLLKVIEKI